VSALSGAAVGAGKILGPLDTHSAQPLSAKNPGASEEKWMVTSCLNCQARCAIRVRVVNGKAVKITGNPNPECLMGRSALEDTLGSRCYTIRAGSILL